jgi:hypothetical protein
VGPHGEGESFAVPLNIRAPGLANDVAADELIRFVYRVASYFILKLQRG